MKAVLLFLTHTWSDDVQREFAAMSRAKNLEAWLLTDSRNPYLQTLLERYPRCHVFDVARRFGTPYAWLETGGLGGHGHFPLLDFFAAHPDFEHYWVVEYDVRYTGEWNRFFARFDRIAGDLLTTHIRTYAEEPGWNWWVTFGHPDRKVPVSECIRSFNVIYRMGARALRFLDRELRTCWYGHYELLLSTLLHRGGFTLVDLGGNGPFSLPGLRNRAYTSTSTSDGAFLRPGTIRYRPVGEKPGVIRNKLYHPVKQRGDPGGYLTMLNSHPPHLTNL